MSTHTTEQATTTSVESLLHVLGTQGKTWARYGLTVGRLALETQSRTLGVLAQTLGTLASRLEHAEEPVEAPPASVAPTAKDSAPSA